MKAGFLGKFPLRLSRQLSLALAFIGLSALAMILYLSLYDKQDGLSDANRAEFEAVYESMNRAQQPRESNLDVSQLMETQELIKNNRYDEAKVILYNLLSDDSLLDLDKKSIFTELGYICFPLEDLECVDRVVEFYKGESNLGYMYLVQAAQLAEKKGNTDKKTEYYRALYEELEKAGGEEFVSSLNEQSINQGGIAQFDYNAIKEGSQL